MDIMKGKIREILNKIRWNDVDNFQDYKILYIHRGAPNDQKEVNYSLIIDITASFFVYQDDLLDEPTYIPFHRILEIKNVKKNEILWVK